jgi:hypothetical protein
MDVQEMLKYMDELVFAQTGRHLDSLQTAILKGVLNGQKYADVAKDYNCTAGHVKDEAYELWRILSEALGEDLNKSNVRATIERLGVANYHSPIVGNRVGSINLCSNSPQATETSEIENVEMVGSETITPIEAARRIVKLETVPQLIKLGLTAEQIAQALELPLTDVQQVMR